MYVQGLASASATHSVMAPSRKASMFERSKKAKQKAATAEAIALRIKAVHMKPIIASDGAPAIMSAGQKNAADIARRIKAVQQMKRHAASGATATASKMMNATTSQAELNVIPSEETVSAPRKVRYSRKAKSQSTSVSRNAKSKKKKEQPNKKENPNITGGLQLLTRQMVTTARVTKRLIRGIQLPIDCDDHGTPVGPNAKDMQSYIGVLACTTVPIIFDDWRNVDDEYKDKIWESIEEAYVIPKQCRKHVLKSASSKWRGFKSSLTTHYIVPFMETPEKLENPPDDYRCIPKLHWSLFVEDRVSGEFKELRQVQKTKRGLNKYNHRMSRKGYAQTRVELAKKLGVPIEMLDRATMWLAAHSDKDGNFTSPEVEKAAKRIEILKKKEAEGSLTTEGSTDVLTLALKKPEHPGKDLTCDDEECRLAVDTVDNIVAIGRVMNLQVETGIQLIHGVPLGENHVRVTVIRAIEGDAFVPIPVRDETLTVDDAVGSCVAWPKDLVVTPAAKAAIAATHVKKPRRGYGRKTGLPDENDKDLEHLPPNLPHDLKDLCTWANKYLTGGKTINTIFVCELFGRPKKAAIFRSDVYKIAHGKEVSNGAIMFYMSYLHRVMKKNKMEDMFQFVDYDLISAIGSGTPTTRSHDLSVIYSKGKPGQIFLIPYNTGNHWTLTIVNPTMETARYMDPLKRRLDGSEWPSIVTSSLKMYKGLKKSTGKKKSSPWKPLLGAPIQNDSVSCGYYVMRYIEEILEDNDLDLDKKWGTRAGLTYTTQQLDEVRGEWAKYVLQFPDN